MIPSAPDPAARDVNAPGYRAAHLLSYTVNPLVLPVLLFGLVPAHAGAPPQEVGAGIAVGLVFFLLIPSAYLVWMVRSRRAATLEIRERRQRTAPFLVGIASSAAALPVLHGTAPGAFGMLGVLTGCLTLNAVLLALLNLRWKISVHAAAAAGFVSILHFVAGLAAPPAADPLLRTETLPLLLCALPLVGWARVRTGAHTTHQVLGGTLFGLAVPYAELMLLARYGLFPLS